MAEDVIATLQELGFTAAEAKAYVALLKYSPATGYELASRSGVPRSAIYGVIKRLESQGLVNAVGQEPARYVALPPADLEKIIEARFAKRLHGLKSALESLAEPAQTSLTWTIQGYESVLEEAERLITGTKKSLYGSLWGREAHLLSSAFRHAKKSKVEVILFSFNALGAELGTILACVCKEPGICNLGASCPGGSPSCDPGTNGTCETTLWHEVNDDSCIPTHQSGLNPWTEAAVVPETFHPSCPQTFTVITRGTAIFKNAFGWYNATGAKPKTDDLHVMLDCDAKAGDKVVLDLSKESAYAGGEIGFFLITPEKSDGQSGGTGQCDSTGCCASLASAAQGHGFIYYSERAHNPDYSGSTSWIHLLTYGSHIFDDTFYFAWEDSNKSPNNDFTDLVTSVSGIRCSGAGVACDTGAKGICGSGVTVCQAGAPQCEPLFQAGAEACNGLDDDCNGAVDDGASCANPKEVCHQGKCVPHCKLSEFGCPGGSVCDDSTGLCVAAACSGKKCAEGEVCRDGACSAPCSGVVCPHGQTCAGDQCVDLCANVTCPSGEVCSQGKCFPHCAQCDGLTCAKPLACDAASGVCADPSCAGGCPAGSYCEAGTCKDACDGAKCPLGQSCVAGACCEAGACGASDGGVSMGGTGSGGTSGDAGPGTGASANANGDDTSSGCGCRASSSGGQAAIGWIGIFFGAFGRRRRKRR